MRKPHYAWAVCFTGTLLLFCNLGFCSNVISVYLPFIEDTGISGSMGSAILTIRCTFSFLATFFVTKYYEKISLRKGAALATCLGGLGFFVYSIGGSIWVYYLGAVICGIAYGLGTIIPMSLLITNWFNEKKGLAMGIATAGSGLSTVIFPPIVTKLILAFGLKTAFLFQVCCMLFCGLLIFLIARDHPEDIGMTAYGDPDAQVKKVPDIEDGFVIPRYVYVHLGIMTLLFGGAAFTFTGHLSILTRTSGYSAEMAATVVSIFGFMIMVGKLAFGTISDKLGARKASIIFILCFTSGCLCSLLLNGTVKLWCIVLALLIGFGASVFNMGPPLWAGTFASRSGYGKMLRWLQIFYNLGGITFTMIPGIIADHTGEYKSSFCMFAGMMVIVLIMLLIMYELRRQNYTLGKNA